MASMIAVLAGYEGSKKVISASSWLLAKYLPAWIDVRFVNFGAFDGALYRGRYESIDEVQRGGSNAWGKYLSEYFGKIDDEFVIFGLDDYLLSGNFYEDVFADLLARMVKDPSIVCGRLCQSFDYRPAEVEVADGIVNVKAWAAYNVTAQYCLWRRSYLVDLLRRVSSAWDFEINGSAILSASGKRTIGTVTPIMTYPDESSISSKWKGVRVRGNRPEDVEELVKIGALEREVLC